MRFLEVLRAEAKLIFSDIAIVLTVIGGVILYAFLYPQPYASQSVSKLSVSVVDLDRSQVSREIAFKLNATPQISIKRNDMSHRDAKEALLRGEVQAIVLIPKNFSKDLKQHLSPVIAVGADSSYFLIYGAVLEGAMKAVLTQSATLKVGRLLVSGEPLEKARKAYTPYKLQIINLFNKNNSYTQYVIPAVYIIILQQTMLIGLGILGGGINERLVRREDGHYTRAPIWMMMTSRYIIFGALFFLHMLFYFGFSFSFFEVTHLANIADLLNLGVAFITACIFFGIFLGSIFNAREVATPIILFSSLPLVFSVGFIWPQEAIPTFIQNLSLLSPSTPAMQGFLRLNQMGAEFGAVVPQYVILWLQALIYAILGYYYINKNRKKYVTN
ncbi:MAG: ABC transporter permease [Campylobacterota bacterium]|nr:ABC transporter permease [Campylobacterota bacterium]